MISTGANLYHDLHYALNFTLHRGSPFLDDRVLYEQGVIRIYDVLFPATVLLETDAYIRDFLVRERARRPVSTAEFHYRLGRICSSARPGCEEYSVVARAARAGVPIYTSSPGDSSIGMNIAFHELMNGGTADDRSQPGRQRGLRHHPGRREERLRDPRRRFAEELLPAGAADVCGRCTAFPRAATTTSSRSRPIRSSGAACRARRRGGRELGQGQSRRAARYGRDLRDSTIAFPLFCEYAIGSKERPAAARELVHKRDALVRYRSASRRGRRRAARRAAGIRLKCIARRAITSLS